MSENETARNRARRYWKGFEGFQQGVRNVQRSFREGPRNINSEVDRLLGIKPRRKRVEEVE